MKPVRIINIAVLLFLGTALSGYAQQEPHDREAKPAEHAQKAAPAQQAQQSKPAAHAQKAAPAQQARQSKPAAHAQKAAPAQRAQQAQRASGNQSRRIPDARFRASFGRDHTFRMNRSNMAGGSPRFQHGGFWFGMLAPWPVAWQYTDNVYVDYIDGAYYLCDARYPGAQVAISVTL